MPPFVDTVSPSTGPVAGGTTVNIYGNYFIEGATVTFCGIEAEGVMYHNESWLSGTTPENPSCGTPPCDCDVEVTNPNGQDGTLAGGFTYE